MAVLRQVEKKRRAGREVPDLAGVDPMPGRDLMRPQQKVNAGERAAAAACWPITKRLDIVAALGCGAIFSSRIRFSGSIAVSG
jgi:hypothetical protein